MSERGTWENCPACGGLAVVGWSGDASFIDDDNLPG
jgi:hypothetical protein